MWSVPLAAWTLRLARVTRVLQRRPCLAWMRHWWPTRRPCSRWVIAIVTRPRRDMWIVTVGCDPATTVRPVAPGAALFAPRVGVVVPPGSAVALVTGPWNALTLSPEPSR